MDEVFRLLVNPLVLLIGGLGLLLLCVCFNKKRWVVVLAMLCGLGTYVLSIPAVVIPWAQAWEADFPVVPDSAIPQHTVAIVLGGGVAPATRTGLPLDLGGSADRVLKAAQLYHARKVQFLWLTGGADPTLSASSEAEAMAEVLVQLGVPVKALKLESRSRTTRENASETAEAWPADWPKKAVLITSASHMRRALLDFSPYGFDVYPVATDHIRSPVAGAAQWVPRPDMLVLSQQLIKEALATWRAE